MNQQAPHPHSLSHHSPLIFRLGLAAQTVLTIAARGTRGEGTVDSPGCKSQEACQLFSQAGHPTLRRGAGKSWGNLLAVH